MTRNDFASLGSSMFSVVVRKRLAYAAASEALNAAIDADPCDRRCKCGATKAAEAAFIVAQNERAEAEASWADYCAIRREDIAR